MVYVMSEITTIKVSMETRDALKSIGWKGESYDAILRRLMERAYGPKWVETAATLRDLPDIEKEIEE